MRTVGRLAAVKRELLKAAVPGDDSKRGNHIQGAQICPLQSKATKGIQTPGTTSGQGGREVGSQRGTPSWYVSNFVGTCQLLTSTHV